jgi:hypothetical protein
MERFVGTIGDKRGSLVLQHSGSFDGETAKAELGVVPGSGAGDLEGVEGKGSFEAGMGSEGKRTLTLELKA